MKKRIFRLLNFFAAAFFIFAEISVSCQLASAQMSAQKKTVSQRPQPLRIENKAPENFALHEYEIFRLINLERRKRRLNDLIWDVDLTAMARKYSEKMARDNFFSHFDLQGANVAKRAKNAKIKHWDKIGENLFMVEGISKFDDFAVKGWMKSPGHEHNLLSPEWTTTGVGIAVADNGDIYITQVFINR